MATTTPNYSLRKPDPTDTVDVGTDLNANYDTIDTQLKATADTAAAAVPKAVVDAKGDLIAATAADTVGRLPVGTNGQLLTADSAQPTGLAWSTPTAPVPLSTVDAKGDLLAGTADNTIARVAVGSNGQVLAAASGQTPGVQWQANPTPAVVTLSDVASVALDASAGKVFKLVATGNRTIAAPTNAVDGRGIIIAHTASGGDRTLALTTGAAGAFAFGTDVTALTATTSGTTDYIGAIYDATAQRWRVLSCSKGYA